MQRAGVPRLEDFLEAWEEFLNDESALRYGKSMSRPLGEWVARLITRRYERVLACGGAVTEASLDAEYHRLRIECKKLRYLLEMFRSLFPKARAREVIGTLKALQRTLGDLNDVAVHAPMLEQMAHDRIGARPGESPSILVSRLLADRLDGRREDLRSRSLENFRELARKRTRRRLEQLFRVEPKERSRKPRSSEKKGKRKPRGKRR